MSEDKNEPANDNQEEFPERAECDWTGTQWWE